MMGSFVTRVLIMAFGYAYPAYECYKAVEKNKPAIEQLRFWCQYWILVAVLTVSERFGDAFISWLPMYSEAKLAFFVYLWYPKTRGTTYVYETFFRPYLARHEVEIDRNLLELRARAGDAVVLYWQKAATYGQARFFEILQYVIAHSQSSKYSSGPAQKQQHQRNNAHSLPALVPATKPTTSVPCQQAIGEPLPSPSKNQTAAPQTQQKVSLISQIPAKSQSMQQKGSSISKIPTKSQSASVPAEPATSPAKSQPRSAPEVAASPTKSPSRSTAAEVASSPSRSKSLGASASLASSASSSSSKTNENNSKPSEANSRPASVKDPDHPRDGTTMEETIRVTRGRLRKARSVVAPADTSSTPQQ